LRQLLYFAKTGRPIIVLDERDLSGLQQQKGVFVRLLVEKVRAVSHVKGFPPLAAAVQVDLPPHLRNLCRFQ
jgi:hypothetical protein